MSNGIDFCVNVSTSQEKILVPPFFLGAVKVGNLSSDICRGGRKNKKETQYTNTQKISLE